MTAGHQVGTIAPVTITPRPRQVLPATPEQQADAAATVGRIRAQAAEADAAARPLREAMFAAVAAAGIELRDLAAALGCPCGCHPRIDTGRHEGGRSCPCQQTPAERAAAREQLLAMFADLHAGEDTELDAYHAAIAARAAELGVDARITVLGAPFVLTGTVDGRGFYLRERHGSYRVVISADADPAADPWAADPSVLTLEIADGADDTFHVDGRFDAGRALTVAVAAVRSYLRQHGCTHPRAAAGDRYCAGCGTGLIAPELP